VLQRSQRLDKGVVLGGYRAQLVVVGGPAGFLNLQLVLNAPQGSEQVSNKLLDFRQIQVRVEGNCSVSLDNPFFLKQTHYDVHSV
jgi:hypothetical protein